MSAPVSRASIIASIVRKDFKEFTRDRVYLFLSVIGLVFFIGIFWVVPDTVDETITLGVAPRVETLVEDLRGSLPPGTDTSDLDDVAGGLADAEQEGVDLVQFEDGETLRAVIAGDLEAWRTDDGTLVLRDRAAGDEKPREAERVDVGVGIAFPEGFMSDTTRGQKTTVTVYADAALPPEIKSAIAGFVREAAYQLSGRQLPVADFDQQEIVLGEDRAGDQISIRERMRPMLALLVLMIEVFSLASLISSEVLTRTVQAILVTPARIGDVLAAKTVYGTLLALSQALIVLFAVGAFTAGNWSILLFVMLIGALMFTGMAMVIGSAGKDFIGTLFYGMLVIVPMMIPAFALLLPGTASVWIRMLPTYGMIQVLNGITAYGHGWSEVAPQLAGAIAWVAVIYAVGLFTLKRKVESL
jgi:ABC-2 type transport system permease protein